MKSRAPSIMGGGQLTGLARIAFLIFLFIENDPKHLQFNKNQQERNDFGGKYSKRDKLSKLQAEDRCCKFQEELSV